MAPEYVRELVKKMRLPLVFETWALEQSHIRSIWDNCPQPGWLIYFAARAGVDQRNIMWALLSRICCDLMQHKLMGIPEVDRLLNRIINWGLGDSPRGDVSKALRDLNLFPVLGYPLDAREALRAVEYLGEYIETEPPACREVLPAMCALWAVALERRDEPQGNSSVGSLRQCITWDTVWGRLVERGWVEGTEEGWCEML